MDPESSVQRAAASHQPQLHCIVPKAEVELSVVWASGKASPMLRGMGPSASLALCSFLLQAGWQEGDLLLLVLAGMQQQGRSSWAAVLDRWVAVRDAGAAMLQWPGMKYCGGTGILHGTLVHAPPGLAAATWLLAVQGWAVLLQWPVMDFHRWGADGLYMAHFHPSPGLAKIAALLWRAAPPGWAWLHGLAALRLSLAGPFNVMAEAAGVMARGQVCGTHGAFVAAPCGTVPHPALLTTG